MKRDFSFLFIIFFIIVFARQGFCRGLELYVSPTGNDNWSGTLADPNSSQTDGPFATLERARQEIRNLGELPQDGVTIYLRGGVYTRTGTFKLTSSDSGAVDRPIIWRNFDNESVYFQGGIQINNFHAITDTAVLARIDQAYRHQILQADLTELGITRFPGITPQGPKMELLFRGKPMTISRFPNSGWTTIASVPANDIITYTADISNHVNKWSSENKIWLQGYFYWDWSSSYQAVDSIDTQKRFIYLKPPLHHYGFRSGQRYFFLNILEELDQPGEWLLDNEKGILYFWPPQPIRQGDVYFSLLDSTMILLKQTAHITLQGITFEGTYSKAVQIEGGSDNKIAGCTFRNIISNAVYINGGKRNGITGCDLYNLGAAGIILSGGNRMTLERGDNYADNNHIHHFARIQKTYHPAVRVFGVGQIVSHNYIHHAPHQAIGWNGNEHLFQFNEIHDVAQETGDVGAMYSGRDWTWRGNVIRYNFFHDIHGPGALGAIAVYLDDALSGTTIYGNIFYKTSMGIMIGGGRDNIVQNNIFVSNGISVHVDDRGHGWAQSYIAPGGAWQMYKKLEAVHYNEPPYSEYYPELAAILNGDPALPAGNKIIANIHYGGKWLDFDPNAWGGIVYFENNLITYINPGFFDVRNGDFRLKESFYNYHPYFEPIPQDSIGLYISEYRPVITGVRTLSGRKSPPADFSLHNYPNPFNASTTIKYNLVAPRRVKLTVYNIIGRQVAVLVDEVQSAGSHTVSWSANKFSSGIYFVNLKAGPDMKSRKILLLK